MARTKFTTTLDEDLLAMAKHKASLLDGNYGANEIIEQALRFYFQNASVTVWEKSVNTEDDNKGKHLQKLILRSNRLTLEHIKERTVIKNYDPVSVAPEVLREGGWSKVWDISKIMPH